MSDGLSVTNNLTAGIAGRPSGYQADPLREVRARAASVEQNQTPQEREGLRRLNQILSLDQPLPDNVPRGFYLNIKV